MNKKEEFAFTQFPLFMYEFLVSRKDQSNKNEHKPDKATLGKFLFKEDRRSKSAGNQYKSVEHGIQNYRVYGFGGKTLKIG